MADTRLDENKHFTIKRYSRLKMEGDDVDMEVLLDNDETHPETFDEQHHRMETTEDDVRRAKGRNKMKLGLKILALVLALLIAVIIIVFLVLRFQSHEAEGQQLQQLSLQQVSHNHSDDVTEHVHVSTEHAQTSTAHAQTSTAHALTSTEHAQTSTVYITSINATFIPKQDIVQEIVAVHGHIVTTEEKLDLEGLLLDQPFNIWKIEGLYKKLYENKGQILSHVFPIDGYEFPAQVKLRWDTDQNLLSFELRFVSNGSESTLPIKELPLVAYILEDRSETENKRDLIVIGEQYIDLRALTFDNFGYIHGTSLDKVLNEDSRYFVDDTTYIKIVVEDPQHVTESVQSFNGTLSWTMDNYSLRRQNEIDKFREYQYSVPFYSANPGYRMRLIVYAHGDGSFYGDGVTLGMRILTGRWDQSLPYRTTFKTQITFEDQSSSTVKNPITKTSIDLAGKDGGYYIGYIPHYRIKDDVHLVNDSLSIKVVVKPL